MKNKVIVVDANREISSNVTGVLKKMYKDSNLKIELLSAPRIFQDERLLKLLEANKNTACVFIKTKEFPEETVKKAINNGYFFGEIVSGPTYVVLHNEPVLTSAIAA